MRSLVGLFGGSWRGVGCSLLLCGGKVHETRVDRMAEALNILGVFLFGVLTMDDLVILSWFLCAANLGLVMKNYTLLPSRQLIKV